MILSRLKIIGGFDECAARYGLGDLVGDNPTRVTRATHYPLNTVGRNPNGILERSFSAKG